MEEKIKKLKEKLQNMGTKDLLGMISVQFITFASNGKEVAEQSDIFNKTNLISPQKQYMYLAGLLMSTEDNSNGNTPQNSNFKIYQEIENDIQEITMEYIINFLNFDQTLERSVIKRNLVSMDAFISYFDTGILRYPEQTIELIQKLYNSFDSELKELIGLKTEDFIAFYNLIYDAFEENKNPFERIQKFYNSIKWNADNIDKEYQRLLEFDFKRSDIQEAAKNQYCIKKSKIMKYFGQEKGKTLLNIFSLHRTKRDFGYYNGENPFTNQPLCWLDEETLFIVHPQFVLNAIYNYITDILENPRNEFADKYKKVKAEKVEELFQELFVKIFGENARYHMSVCEERGTKEHDILIEFNNYILIAEVKASKVREPLFNPQKAYTRIRDHFNSHNGIGGVYDQAIALKKFIESKDEIILYENKNKKFIIKDISRKKILPIVLTLNQFGGLAVNTGLILEKEDSQPYPWVCNWHDFENIIEILNYLEKKPEDFIDYICWRIEKHTHILSSDELDVIEQYFMNPSIKKENGEIFFAPNGPNLIDKIYFEKHHIPYEYPPLKLVNNKKKIGRNEPCPCNSGKKFKKCCLGKGIYD